MKEFIYFIFCLLILSFFSCKEEDDIIDNPKSKRISFFVESNPTNYKGTILTTTNFLKFNVYGYSSTNTMSASTILNPYFDNLVVTKNSTWNYIGDYFWPETNYIQFFAVASDENNNALPTGVSSWGVGSTGYPYFSFATNTTTSLQKDLVVAKSLDKTESNSLSGVNMNFEHALTRINISYNKNVNMTNNYTMTKIELTGVQTSAIYTFNESSGIWSNFAIPSTFTYWQGSKTFKTQTITLNENMFIIPQSNITLKFTYKNNKNRNKTQSQIISPSHIGGNLRYIVTITI